MEVVNQVDVEVEEAVAKVTDLENGQMKEVDFAGGKVLLINEEGVFKAVGNRCTHYGAPLKNGSLSKGRIRCPWHGACFNTTTGDIEDFPGLDHISTFSVRVDQDQNLVYVRGSPSSVKSGRLSPLSSSCSASSCEETKEGKAPDDRVFIIVGGGAAGLTCAETLRKEGFAGRILFFSRETLSPYDRPKLSKAMNIEHERIKLRSEEDYFEKNQIETLFGVKVEKVDVEAHKLWASDGKEYVYDKLFVATGADPRRLEMIPGHDLQNIHTLRSLEDSHRIINSIADKNVVLIGSSFIGMEVASCIVSKARSVTVVGMETVPFERVLGAEVGAALQRLHEEKGVVFLTRRKLKEFSNKDGEIAAVVVEDEEGKEEVVACDVCVVGAGVVPVTDMFKREDVRFARDGSIHTDEYLKAATDVYVGGDIARFPYWLTAEEVRVEHWGTAQYHGSIAAKNMLTEGSAPLRSIPFFWTVQYGKSIRFCGHATSFDRVLVDGDLSAASSSLSFVAYYLREGKVVAIATLGRDPVAALAADLLAAHKLPPVEELVGIPPAKLQQLLF
ncbi:Apoptosis-inducing factor 3 [Balamuthia mandrillaris]